MSKPMEYEPQVRGLTAPAESTYLSNTIIWVQGMRLRAVNKATADEVRRV